jgi:hypothetical protein
MMKITLASQVYKGASTVDIEPAGAIDNFDASGGTAYIGRDKFTYSGYSGSTLTGCSGISWSHEAGEQMYLHYGARLRDLVPPILLNSTNDPDDVFETIVTSLDSEVFQVVKDRILDIHKNMDPNRADVDYLKLLCQNIGIEYSESMTDSRKRAYALQAVNLLKQRGTEAAFKFVVWHLLGYRVDVDIRQLKVPAIMNDSSYRMYTPPTPMPISDKTTSYWKMQSYTGSSPYYIPNEIDNGPQLELEDLAMYTGTSSSMFPNMTAITVNNAHPWARADGSANHGMNLHAQEQWMLDWFMKPASGGAYPQTLFSKGTFLTVSRPNATDLSIELDDGTTSVTETATDVVSENSNYYVSIIWDRPSIAIVVNDGIELLKTTMDVDAKDDSSDFIVGDVLGANNYEGRLDALRLNIGKHYPLGCLSYYEHIKILGTAGEEDDRNSYMLDGMGLNYTVEITILNADGDTDKENLLAHLAEEWLTVGPVAISAAYNYPLEKRMGLWDGSFV